MDAPDRIQVRVSRQKGRSPNTGQGQPPDPFTLVIFGASGDLAKRKLIPALYHLHTAGLLPSSYAVVGFSRSPMSDDQYRDAMLDALREQVDDETQPVGSDHPLIRSLYYHPGNNDDAKSFETLKQKLEEIEKDANLPGNRLFYLSVAPRFFPVIIRQLQTAGLVYDRNDERWSRVIIEKPFGTDLASARALNQTVTSALDESQIYRIDHYLGKETVQNILSFRFGNSIFEPLFNRRYVANVQLTVAETLGMEGRRGAYYDTAGTLRDMVQNHMLQLLCLTAMEPPSALEAQSIRDEKVKVLRAVLPMTPEEVAENTVRGQYGASMRDGQIVNGYQQEEGVDADSTTETYVALRLDIDNWRWAGVPFFLRSGKRLRKHVSEIAVQFKQPPLQLFRDIEDSVGKAPAPKSNWLILRIQPDEGICLTFACKQPGMKVHLEDVQMDFYYGSSFDMRSPEAYERLLLDALRGDASLFTRSDEVDYAWRFITSIHDGWNESPHPTFPNYFPFTDGPDEANRLMLGFGSGWRSLREM